MPRFWTKVASLSIHHFVVLYPMDKYWDCPPFWLYVTVQCRMSPQYLCNKSTPLRFSFFVFVLHPHPISFQSPSYLLHPSYPLHSCIICCVVYDLARKVCLLCWKTWMSCRVVPCLGQKVKAQNFYVLFIRDAVCSLLDLTYVIMLVHENLWHHKKYGYSLHFGACYKYVTGLLTRISK